jgi:exopolyphosphatase/guanosine-5'-triphosphate,3'-diphosphate pyrophosphatase
MNPQRTAFVDIGTNTILCLIAELKSDGSFEVLDDLAKITRLGQGIHQTGRISPEGEERSRKILLRYLEECKRLNVQEIIAVGTSALRDAQNSAEVRARFRNSSGLSSRDIGRRGGRVCFSSGSAGTSSQPAGIVGRRCGR